MERHDDDISGLIGDIIRLGTIETVDLAAATAVVRAGDVLSPPLPWLEWSGSFRTWSPPTVGEQVLLIAPEADIAGAVILRGLFSNSFPKLGATDEPQIDGPEGLQIRLTADGIIITAPGAVAITGPVQITGEVQITGDVTVTGQIDASIDVTGGGISLKTHKHGGVQAGGSQTGTPV